MKSSKKALVLVGHGSKLKGFQAPMEKVAKKIRGSQTFDFVECAYLEITSPLIPEAIDRFVEKSIREVFVLPYFVLKGMHTQVDIPEIIKVAQKKYKNKVKIVLCPYLGYDDGIVSLVQKRIGEMSSCT